MRIYMGNFLVFSMIISLASLFVITYLSPFYNTITFKMIY